MKIEITKDALLCALQTASLVAGKNNTMQILSMLSIETDGDAINIYGTDLDRSIKTSCQCTTIEAGQILVPAKRLIAIVKELPEETLTIETKEHNVNIRSGSSKFRIVGSVEDFPFANRSEGPVLFEIAESDLLATVKAAQHAASTDANRHILNSIHFHQIDGELRVASTDGRRLTEQTKPNYGSVFSFTFPLASIGALSYLCAGVGPVDVKRADNGVMFDFGDTTFWTKTVEGKFPDNRQIMDKKHDHDAKIDRESLLKCVQRASLVVSDRNNRIVIEFSPSTLKIIAESSEHGDFEESLVCECNETEAHYIALNPAFLLESLRALSDDSVSLRYCNDALKPLQIVTDRYFEIVMPVKVGG